MCGPSEGQSRSHERRSGTDDDGDFPWDLGVCDAHCHPTDTMTSIESISSMRARVLTAMSTRSQDQDLVASVAAEHGIRDRSALVSDCQEAPRKIVPAFGWHPWFSHQLFDDTAGNGGNSTYDPSSSSLAEQKAKHYEAVLSSFPDAEFVASLPDPKPLSGFLAETRQRLEENPLALIGEVGLDKAFRLPSAWKEDEQQERDEGLTPGGREGRLLSPYHVKMPHQTQILTAQLRLAGELGRAASVHGVQAHGVLFDAISALWKGHEKEVVSRRKQKMVAKGAEDFSSSSEEEEDEDDIWAEINGQAPAAKPRQKKYKPKPFPPRICLHSFSGSAQVMKQYLHPAVPATMYFSFSTVINLATAGGKDKFPELVKTCPDDRILIESDLHTAGEDMDYYLKDICRKICEIKKWTLQEGIEKLRKNYEELNPQPRCRDAELLLSVDWPDDKIP
ncbi:Cut9-interacting protein scn1 [Podospora pseudocomata]|uniref:Cut9-interacting protein scn1 n=1 Tax=Podospora pseudocomata TaxID=2093779 RepID=A0ABR0GIN3_9PEZI|nr:Cut9-interacting protein scn1 [Podospora pseudocomata]